MMRRLCLFFAIAASLASPARATWFEATTPHFVIDADGSEARVRDFAARLERFDGALRTIYRQADDPSRRSNRVHVYAVSVSQILSLCNGCPSQTMGFYQARAGEPRIFTTALAGGGGLATARNLDLDPQEVLFHEYSHHFMYSSFPNSAFPAWFSEGFADFNANTVQMPDGNLYVGTPANYRAYTLRTRAALPMRRLLDPRPADMTGGDDIYARGWLLIHYLMLSNDRRPELDDYLRRIVAGEPSVKAGEAAFGDLRKLDGALDRYMNGKLNPPLVVPAAATTPEVEVRPLSPGAAAMMLVHLRSTAGVDAKMATRLVPEAEHAAAPFPGDVRVQDELAEAEFDAGRLDQAGAACDRALALAPNDVTALLYRARIATRRLAEARSKDAAAWDAARRWVVRANRADTEAAKPLILYYETYRAQGAKPPKIAVDGLWKAETLAGEDKGVHWLLARQSLDDDDAATAAALLRPVAYAPHGDQSAERARAIVGLIEAGHVADAKAAFPGADDAPPAAD